MVTPAEVNQSEVKPNRGASVADVEANGRDSESVDQWRQKNGINSERQIKLVKISHIRYQHHDLDEIKTFLQDFGMHVVKSTEDEIFLRGYGPDPYVYYARKGPNKFLGGAFEVASYSDLERAAQLPHSGPIKSLDSSPGGGDMVELVDPEGFPICLIHGQTPAEVGTLPEKLIVNYGQDKPRIRNFQRFEQGPAAVHKLGHYGLCVQNFDEQVKWYTENFNIVPSDFLYVPLDTNTKKVVGIFAHIDRGLDYVDHHSFFMTANKTSHVHHCSFEVHDFDTQHLGHQWLAKKNYRSVWGVGRHILGSQIFDYWWDTNDNMVEHYADGDLVNMKTPIGYNPAEDESLAVWGPEVPKTFLD